MHSGDTATQPVGSPKNRRLFALFIEKKEKKMLTNDSSV